MVDLPALPPQHPGMDRRRFLRCSSPWSPFPKETAAFALRHRLPAMTLMGPLGQVGRLIVNMKTANALGFTLPLLLTRADQVIE